MFATPGGAGATACHTSIRPRGLSRGQRELGTCIITRAVSFGGSSLRALVLEQAAAHNVLAGVAVTERRATAARADQLVAVPDGEDRFVSQFDSERNRARKQIAVAARPDQGVRAADANQERPDDALVEPRPELDLVRPRLAPDLCAPRLDILDVLDLLDHLAVCQQSSVVVAAVDPRDEAADASPDVDGIVHDLPHEMMTPDVRGGPHLSARGALKRPEKAHGSVWADLASGDATVQTAGFAGLSWMARPGLEPGTPRFSVVCSTN